MTKGGWKMTQLSFSEAVAYHKIMWKQMAIRISEMDRPIGLYGMAALNLIGGIKEDILYSFFHFNTVYRNCCLCEYDRVFRYYYDYFGDECTYCPLYSLEGEKTCLNGAYNEFIELFIEFCSYGEELEETREKKYREELYKYCNKIAELPIINWNSEIYKKTFRISIK